MKNMPGKVVFVLAGDVEVRASVGQALGSLDIEVIFFIHPVKCLEQLRSRKCDLLVIDSKMHGSNGFDLAKQIERLNSWIPVVVITDRGDVAATVRAMTAGAVDVVEKPLDEERLKRTVGSIMRENVFADARAGNPLTSVETRVLKLIIDGKSNKEAAHLLNRSIRTIEWHRANVMRKLGTDNLIGLIKQAAALGIIDLNDEEKNE